MVMFLLSLLMGVVGFSGTFLLERAWFRGILGRRRLKKLKREVNRQLDASLDLPKSFFMKNRSLRPLNAIWAWALLLIPVCLAVGTILGIVSAILGVIMPGLGLAAGLVLAGTKRVDWTGKPPQVEINEWVKARMWAEILKEWEALKGREPIRRFLGENDFPMIGEAFVLAFAEREEQAFTDTFLALAPSLNPHFQSHLLLKHPAFLRPSTAETLLPFLESQSAGVRMEVLTNLREAGIAPGKRIAQKVEKDTDETVRSLAQNWGGNSEKDSFLDLARSAWGEESPVFEMCVKIQKEMAGAPESVRKWLEKVLEAAAKNHPRKSDLSIFFLAYEGDLVKLMKDLATWKGPRFDALWIDLVLDRPDSWREAAFIALEQHTSLERRDFKLTPRQHPVPKFDKVKKYAPYLENGAGLRLLEPTLGSEKYSDREEVFELLQKFSTSAGAKEWAKAALETDDPFRRAAAVVLISRWPELEGLDLLVKMPEDWWEQLRLEREKQVWLPDWPKIHQYRLKQKMVMTGGIPWKYKEFFCHPCRRKAVAHQTSIGTFPVCSTCGSVEELRPHTLKVTGYLGPDRELPKEVQKLHLPLWNEAQKEPIAAEVDEVILEPGLKDPDWALSAVFMALQNHHDAPENGYHFQKPESITLSDNTKRLLRPVLENPEVLEG